MRAACRVFGGETWGKEPLGRPRPRCNEEDITEINLTEIGWKGVGWFDLAHDGGKNGGLLMNTVLNTEELLATKSELY
jgi:hypothetical protein